MSSCPMHDKHVTSPGGCVCDRSRTNSEFDSIRGEFRFFECRKTGSQTESKNRFIRFFSIPVHNPTIEARLQHSRINVLLSKRTKFCVLCASVSVDDVLRQSLLIISPVTRRAANWPLVLELKLFVSNNVHVYSY